MANVKEVTSRIIHALYRDGTPDKAILSSLRNAPTIVSHGAENVWPILMANLDENQLSHDEDGTPTPEEVAVYTAIRFYAIQQQGNRDSFVYASAGSRDAKGKTLFGALSTLRGNEESHVSSTTHRVQVLLATTSVAGVINGLSHLISILKSHNGAQKIDYAWLAQDLYALQCGYDQASRVRLRWGQQFYAGKQETESEGEKTND